MSVTGKVFFTKYLDIIVSSAELKRLILDRCDELGVSIYNVSDEAGINYNTFKQLYLQKDEPQCSPALRQEHIIKMAELVGIKVKVTLVLTPIDKVDVEELKNRPFKNDRRKKRNTEDPDSTK